MQISNPLAFSAFLLSIGMLAASTVSIAAPAPGSFDASQMLQQDEEEQQPNESSTIIEPVRTFNGGANAAEETFSANSSVEINRTQTVSNGTTPNANTQPQTPQTTYPKFTQAELNELFRVSEEDISNPIPEAPGNENGGESDKPKLESSEEVAQLYRQLPVNPVYTYGTDGNEKACAGTEAFCSKSHFAWANLEEKIKNNEPITFTEGDNAGRVVMPKEYEEGNVPQVVEEEAYCKNSPLFYPYPRGNSELPEGNDYRSMPHCGKWVGKTYKVRQISYK